MLTTVVFAIDDAYCEPLLVAILSLSRNNPRHIVDNLDIVVLHEDISEASRREILRCADTMGIKIELRRAMLPDLPFNTAYGGSRANYLRLAIPETVGERDRVLYLDSDIIVLTDITPLLNIDLQGMPIGAVRDSLNPTLATGNALTGWQRLGLGGNQEYFNSGVMIIDLPACRSDGLFTRAYEAVADYSEHLRLWDQDALNIAAANSWYRLARRWNTIPFSSLRRTPWIRYKAEHIISAEQLMADENEAAIMHYVSPSKPWRGLLPSGYANDLYQKHKAELQRLAPSTSVKGNAQ